MKELKRSNGHDDLADSRALGALAHPARIAILRHLSCHGACCCKDVVAQLDLAQSTVSQHLKILVEAGLVKFKPEMQRSRYSINGDAMRGLASSIAVLAESCCGEALNTRQDALEAQG